MHIHAKGHRQHDHFHHQLCPDHTVKSHGYIHDDQKGNIQKPLAAKGKNCRLRPLPHGLKGIADQKIHRCKRHCQTGDPQKSCSQLAGLSLGDKQMKDLRGKHCKAGHKTGRQDQRRSPGEEGYRPHPLIIFCRIIIAYQRHKSLAQSHGNIQRELIDPLYDPVGCHRYISISGRQLYNNHI